jgi:hypothetical protein
LKLTVWNHNFAASPIWNDKLAVSPSKRIPYCLLHIPSEDLKEKKPHRYLVVIPEINDFEDASQRRWRLQQLETKHLHVNGRSVQVLATLAGISTAYWYQIEQEKRQWISEETLRGIEQALGLDLGRREVQ